MNRNNSSARRVDDGPTSLTNFGKIAKPPLAPEKCIGGALVNEGHEAPKRYLPPVEARMLSSAAGGLLSSGTASTAMRTVFPRPFLSWSLGRETKRRAGRTNFDQLAPPYWTRVIQTKSRQTLLFDPGGCTGHLRACPFIGGWRAFFFGEAFVGTPDSIRDWSVFG